MKSHTLATAAFLTIISLSQTTQAANPEQIRQLLASKQCQNCDLSGAGLVMADLSGGDLSGANLAGANLSRANLSGADLRGANLSDAVLFGANLSNAKLNGATVVGADLRNTYLVNVQLTDVKINDANLQGATGIPLKVVKPEEFYAWGIAEAQKGNQQDAINYFNQAIAIKSDYASAYLARGVARYQLFDRKNASQDAQTAVKFFTSQKDSAGLQTAQAFVQELQAPPPTEKTGAGKPSLTDLMGSLGSVLLQFFPL